MITNDKEEIILYEAVLAGKVTKFPANYFQGVDGKIKIRNILKHLIYNKLNLKEEEIPLKVSARFLQESKLGTALREFDSSPAKLCQFAFEVNWEPWQFKSMPKKYYEEENIKYDITTWILENKIKGLVRKSAYEKLLLELEVRELHNLAIMKKTPCLKRVRELYKLNNVNKTRVIM